MEEPSTSDFDVQAYLRSLSRFGVKPGLERIRRLLALLGEPHKTYKTVHVGGTNGKGSISAYLSSILRTGGKRVGLYTSPHLVRYNERIQVDGTPIPDEALAAIFAEVAGAAKAVRDELGTDPTEFEVGTAAAFLYFARQGVDIAVVEVGLGGRLDSTNVIESEAVVLGPISLDHTELLGRDVGAIAWEKAGIFRPGTPVVSSPQLPEAERVLQEEARRIGAPMVWVREAIGGEAMIELEIGSDEAEGRALEHVDKVGDDPADRGPERLEEHQAGFDVGEWDLSGGTVSVTTPWRHHPEVRVPLLGRHQLQNAAVAVTTADLLDVKGMTLSPDVIRRGIAATRWPGRLELIPGRPPILLDGVHNPGGAAALAHSLASLVKDKRTVFVVAVLGEKEVEGVLGPILPFASEVIATSPASARTAPAAPEQLAEVARRLGASSRAVTEVARALAAACESAGPDGLICVCGSLYLVGEVKGLLESGEDPRRC